MPRLDSDRPQSIDWEIGSGADHAIANPSPPPCHDRSKMHCKGSAGVWSGRVTDAVAAPGCPGAAPGCPGAALGCPQPVWVPNNGFEARPLEVAPRSRSHAPTPMPQSYFFNPLYCMQSLGQPGAANSSACDSELGTVHAHGPRRAPHAPRPPAAGRRRRGAVVAWSVPGTTDQRGPSGS